MTGSTEAQTGRTIRAPSDRLAASAAIGELRVRYGWLAWPMGIAAISRVYSLVLLYSASIARHLPLFGPSGITMLWDARWYLGIAQNGYHAQVIQKGGIGGHHDYAFFPVWPIVLRLTSLGHIAAASAAAVLAPILFVVAAALIALVLAPAFGRTAATGGVALLAFSPAAYSLSMGYSEPLFLVLAALALLASTPGRRGLAAGLAMLTRIAGAAIVAAEGARFLQSRGRDRVALAGAIGGVLGFAIWWVTVALISHSPTGFLEGSPDWGRTSGIADVLFVLQTRPPQQLGQLAFGVLVGLGAILALRRDLRLGTYALAAIGLSLLPGGFVTSMPRYAIAAFPAFAALAARAGPRLTIGLAILFAIAQIGLVYLAFVGSPRFAP